MSQTRIFLVGAGPGDPSLLTLRGLRCLQQADVVVYDHRVDRRLLDLAPAGAERIDVGAAAPKALDQDAITFLVAEKVRDGKVVVRLKWGDPFLFDSGGKEALFFHEQGIPFEVVPGVPIAIAGPAYAGIPITYPDAGDAVLLVRGHEAEDDAPARIDWKHAAAMQGTLVCHAGAGQITAIARALIEHGRPEGDAAALVYEATRPAQQTVLSTLGEIAGQARPGQAALLIVGAVAGFREHMRWFDARPLSGRRIVVTRAREQAGDLIERLEGLGAEVVAMPTIRIAGVDDPAGIDEACDAAHEFHWIVFTSANGVEYFMSRFVARRDIRDLKGVRLCAVGPQTAASLERFAVRVDLTPLEFRAEAVTGALGEAGPLDGCRVLLPRGEIARELLGDDLRKAGAAVREVVVYRTLPESESGAQDVYRQLLDRQVDAVTFTSASTVRQFVQAIGSDHAADLLRAVAVAAIGPVTAEAAQQLGISTAVMPDRYTVPALVDALVTYFRTGPQPAATSS